MPLTLILICLVFSLTILSLQERTVKYQIKRIAFAVIVATLGVFISMLHSKVAMLSGRWWYTFPFLTTAWNDSTAYFCGVAFGRHKLIGLSPNKTLQGFLGALVCNILTTLYVADMVLSGSHFWTCPPRRYTIPFEDY